MYTVSERTGGTARSCWWLSSSSKRLSSTNGPGQNRWN